MVTLKGLLAGLLLAVACIIASPVQASPPALLLAEIYRGGIDPGAYWVSEKLDGVRAYWDGQRLYFRSGHPVPAPAWFTRDFPVQPLDGELWLGRGTFERLSSIVRKTDPVDEEWRQVRYMVFELPQAPGTFTVREEHLAAVVAEAHVPWLQRVEQFRIADRESLNAKLDEVVAAGGEGLMLHRADALYSSGRNSDLLKLKPYLDREARVIAYQPGKGRYAGKMGALLVEDEAGRRFRVGSGFSTADRERPPPIGSLITYRYRGLTAKGLPRFPTFMRIHEEF